jgi:hypothetical protein
VAWFADPRVALAVGVLIVNDHLLKGAWPGLLTGKLSDLAGLIIAPLLVLAGARALADCAGRRGVPLRMAAIEAAILSAIAFAAVKTLPPAADTYRIIMGVARWPIDALAALTAGGGLPPIRPVVLAMDPTDLVVLPAVLVGAWLATRVPGRREPHPSDGR